jgi:argininosuccinate lyase
MYASWAKLLGGLRVDPAAALAVIAGDYSTMTEVADTLLREADVPFRVAHHYASELTDYGRTQGKRPDQLTDAEITRVYQQANGTELPVAPGVIRDAMDPVKMVESRRGLGGPQPAEVRRMLAGAATGLEAQRAWLEAERRRLAGAAASLEKSFDAAAQ